MWTFRALRCAVILLVAVIGGMVKTHPKEAESNTAAWLDSVGFSSWGESFTPVTDDWILAGCIAVAVLWACSFFIPRARLNHADAAAIKQSPGNGWRVSRRMMNLWSMRKVEALCQDFLAQPHKTDEVRVLAARAIRQHRAEGGTERGSWEFWSGLEVAMQEHGEEAVTQAITALDEEFPPSWWRKRRMIHAAAREARMFRLERQRETESQPSLEQEGLAAEEITGDGKEVAKMMLRAPDLAEVERFRTTYKRASHPEGRLFEHFVNKAYSYRLDKAGERDKAQEFHDVTESQDKDSVRENIEFALLVQEAKEDAKHDERGKR